MQEKKVEISIGRRRTRLLCPDCGTLEEVKKYSNEILMAVLSCGDVRTLGLLPSAPGAVTLENILANDELAQRWYPFEFTDKRGTEVNQETRELWAA